MFLQAMKSLAVPISLCNGHNRRRGCRIKWWIGVKGGSNRTSAFFQIENKAVG